MRGNIDSITNNIKILTSFAVIWFILATTHSHFLILCALISITLILLICHKMKIITNQSFFLNINFIKYATILIKDIIASAITVVKIIYSSELKIKPGTQTISMAKLNKREKILFANFITMTPGTFVIAVSGDEFLIHTITGLNISANTNSEIKNILYKIK